MNNFKETEIGLIPAHWDYVPLGKALSGSARNGIYKPKEYHGKGIRMVNMGELFAFDKLPDIDMARVELTKEELEKSSVLENDLLFARRSLVAEGAGKCTVVLPQKEPLTFESSIIRLRPDLKKSNAHYLFYLFESRIGKYLLRTILRQVAVSGITGTDLVNLKIPLPPLSEQKQIADILSCLDAKIDNLKRQNETLEKIAQLLFKRWFIDFEFPDEDGNPYKSSGSEMISSELGDIPAGWRVGKLGEEFKIIMGQSPEGASYNEKGEGIIFFQGRTDFCFRFPTTRLYTTEPKRIAEKGDILVSVRAPVGDINIAVDKCCIGRGLSAVRSQYPSYCFYKLKSYKRRFNTFEKEGTVFGSITQESFNQMSSLFAQEEIINKFNILVLPIDSKIANSKMKCINLKS